MCRSLLKRPSVAKPTKMKIGSRLNHANSMPKKSPVERRRVVGGHGWREIGGVKELAISWLSGVMQWLTFHILDVCERDWYTERRWTLGTRTAIFLCHLQFTPCVQFY